MPHTLRVAFDPINSATINEKRVIVSSKTQGHSHHRMTGVMTAGQRRHKER